MADSILLETQRRVAETVRAAAGSWESVRPNSPPAGQSRHLSRELAEAMRLTRSWPQALRDATEAQWLRADAGEIEDYQTAGEATLRTFEETVQALLRVQVSAEVSARQGPPIEGKEELDRTLEEVLRLRDEFVAGWPWVNEQLIAEARAEYARGEFRSVEEILDELQGQGP